MPRKKKVEETVEEVKVESTEEVVDTQGEALNDIKNEEPVVEEVKSEEAPVVEEVKAEETPIVEEVKAEPKKRKKSEPVVVEEEEADIVAADPVNDVDTVVKKAPAQPIKVGCKVRIKDKINTWYTGALIPKEIRGNIFYVKIITTYGTALINTNPKIGSNSDMGGEILVGNLIVL